jgi:catechol 2,3-dioxygenase-like lactoylglutathione lyase family enzyme
MGASRQDALVRGIDHAGVTVPSIEEATRFFTALGAEAMYDLIVPGTGTNEGFGVVNGVEPLVGDGQRAELSAAALGLPHGVRLLWMRMLRLGGGATIELFQFRYDGQREPARACDLGLQHLAVYVEDIDVASDLIAAAGAELLEGPNDCPGIEAGPGARWRYARLPWGGLIELITYPGPMPYEGVTPLRRTWWRDTGGVPTG